MGAHVLIIVNDSLTRATALRACVSIAAGSAQFHASIIMNMDMSRTRDLCQLSIIGGALKICDKSPLCWQS